MRLGFAKAVSLLVTASSSVLPGPDGTESCSETSGSERFMCSLQMFSCAAERTAGRRRCRHGRIL